MTTTTPIRQVLVREFGGPENVSVVSAQLPAPSTNEVQCSVIYSGFSGSDINMRLGTYPLQKKAPLTLGYCFVGRVLANGPSSGKYQPGTLVSCLSIYDSEATLINVPEKYLIPVPQGLDLKAACALILDWNTAAGLVRTAKVSKGQKVFIHGCSGAVGSAIMSLSLLAGAEVYGTASASKHNAIKELGATQVFDYRTKDWMKEMLKIGGADAVFDALGFESWDESYEILAPNGMLVGYGGNLNTLNGEKPRSVVGPTAKLLARNVPGMFCGRKTRFYYISRDDKTFVPDLERLFGLALEGKIQVPIKRIYELEDVQEAHRTGINSGGVGSLLIRVAEE